MMEPCDVDVAKHQLTTKSDILGKFKEALEMLSGRRIFDVKTLFTDVCRMALHNTNMCFILTFCSV